MYKHEKKRSLNEKLFVCCFFLLLVKSNFAGASHGGTYSLLRCPYTVACNIIKLDGWLNVIPWNLTLSHESFGHAILRRCIYELSFRWKNSCIHITRGENFNQNQEETLLSSSFITQFIDIINNCITFCTSCLLHRQL